LKAARGSDQPEKRNGPANNPAHVNFVENVSNPSIDAFPAPADKAIGLGIILAAGGGNRTLNVGWEGTDMVPWFHERGISVVVLRYRLRPYSSSVDAAADTARAFKVTRANAEAWRIDPKRLGIMGFSAGGEQAAWVGMKYDLGKLDDPDPIERFSSRPDFLVLIYPGWGRMEYTVPTDAPPAFLTSAGLDDYSHAKPSMDFADAWMKAKRLAEVHIYAHGGHANGMQPRNGIPFGTWQHRFIEWAYDQGLMNADGKPRTIDGTIRVDPPPRQN
jgi:hypothetical protein